MKSILTLSFIILFGLSTISVANSLSGDAVAPTHTVTLSIPSMNCAVCPITVKKALKKVPGVLKVKTSLKNKTALVKYNPSRVNIKTLLDATKKAGYPAKIKTTHFKKRE